MTDLKKFIKLYKSFGIDCLVNEELYQNKMMKVIYFNDLFDTNSKITRSDKFGGYAGFYSTIIFDMKGKFIGQDFWE